MTDLREFNNIVQRSRTCCKEGKGFVICYLGKNTFAALEKELETLLENYRVRREKLHLITPCFEYLGVFCIQSDLMPDNASMMGWVEESKLNQEKDKAGWPR
jgi:hypothetical protein